MQYSFKTTGSFPRAEPFWSRYVFALVVSLLAWALEIFLNTQFATPITPFLPGFAAVIASAAWAGFGPGVFSTMVVMGWAVVFLHGEHRHSLAGEVVRCAMFLAEGLLLSIGSGRLRRATHAAARSEDWHRKIVDTASEGIWVVDERGKISFANPRMAEMLGVQGEELTGRDAEEFFFQQDRSAEKIRFDNRRAGIKAQFDRRLRKSDGAEIWVLACADVFCDAQNGSLSVLSMMTDITERKKAEQALRRSEERFRGLFENVLEGVYQSTPDGRILAANPMLLRMLGLSNEAELNDVNIARDLYVDSGVRSRLLYKLEQNGSFQNVEYELRRRDGQIITVQENARVVRDEEGAVLYYEGTLTDVTERTRIEGELRQAQKEEALGRLAGGIAHDFSNVLTVISGYAHLVLEDVAPAHPARANAEHLVAAAESTAALTAQLLSFSHRETGTPTLTELNAILRGAEDAIDGYLNGGRSGAAVRLTYLLHPGPLFVHADAGHVRQILLSLTTNVRDAMADIQEVRIATVTESMGNSSAPSGREPGQYAVLSVQAPADVPASEVRTAEPPDGFGISTTQAILSQYGGFLSMERLSGGGVCFSVYLPLVDDANVSGDAPGTRQKTILLVDDEPLVRELSRELLERYGYKVLLARSAREAEQIGRDDALVDLLITHVAMPGTNGIELARRLRAGQPDMKAIFISADGDERLQAYGLSPFDGVLRKPFSADSLGRKIRQVLDRS